MKKLWPVLLAVGLACALVLSAPMAAEAEAGLHLNGVQHLDDNQHITNAGVVGSGKPATSGYACFSNGVLTLNNYRGEQITVEGMDLTIELMGEGNELSCPDDDTIEANDANVTILGSGALKLTPGDEEGIDVDNGSLTIKGGRIQIRTDKTHGDANHGMEVDGGTFTMEGGRVSVEAQGLDACGLHVPKGHVLLKGGSLSIRSEADGVQVGSKQDALQQSNPSAFLMTGGELTIRAGSDGVNACAPLTISGGKASVDANERALNAYGHMTLKNAALTLTAHDPRGLAAAACQGLTAPGLPVLANVVDPWAEADDAPRLVYAIGRDGAPLRSVVTGISTQPPRTGDSTPVALLCLLAALSLAGMRLLRKRSAGCKPF